VQNRFLGGPLEGGVCKIKNGVHLAPDYFVLEFSKFGLIL